MARAPLVQQQNWPMGVAPRGGRPEKALERSLLLFTASRGRFTVSRCRRGRRRDLGVAPVTQKRRFSASPWAEQRSEPGTIFQHDAGATTYKLVIDAGKVRAILRAGLWYAD